MGIKSEFKEEVILENKLKYTGQWANNLRHGKGTQIWSDGARYDGFFIKDD